MPQKSGKTKQTEKNEKFDEANEVGTVSRKEYEKLKRRAIRFEPNNSQYILVIPCDGNKGWCELGDNSALLYKYGVCEKLGAAVGLSDDSDSYYTQFVLGRVRTRGFEVVRRRLKKAELYDEEQEKDRCVIFKLKKKFDKDEMQHMLRREQERQEKINNITKIDLIDPPMYREIMEIMKRLRAAILKKMDRVTRPVVGEKIYGSVHEMSHLYYEVSKYKNKKEENEQSWLKMRSIGEDLIIDLQILGEQKVWERDFCADIGAKVDSIIKKIDKHLKR